MPPEAVQNSPGESEDGQEPRRKFGRFLSLLSSVGRLRWPIVCLFQLGMIAGLCQVRTRPATLPAATAMRPPRAMPSDKRETVKKIAPIPPQSAFPLEILAHGDQLVRAHRFERALEIYRSLLPNNEAAIPAMLRYRIALCLECLGRWDLAIAEYGAVRSSASDPVLEIAAQHGQVRIWMHKRNSAEAKNLISDLILRSGSPAFRDRPFLPEAVLRLAILMAQEAVGLEPPGALRLQAVTHAAGKTSCATALDWVTKLDGGGTADGSQASRPLHVENARQSADQIIVSGSLHRGAVSEVLQQLAGATDRQSMFTPRAQQVIAERTAALTLDSLPLSTVLTAVTEPFGIMWEVSDDAIHFCCVPEVSDEALQLYRGRFAERSLVDAIDRYPGHALSAYARLALGNLEYSRNRFAEAAAIYEKLAYSRPRSPVAIEASYNLGVALRELGEHDSAREALYRVLDGAPSHSLAPLACLLIGRMHMDQGEFESAIAPLRRASAIAAGTDSHPAAVLSLASSYLLLNDAASAGRVLNEHRDRINNPPFRNAAAFLSSYARMLNSTGRRQAQREARVLMWATFGASRENLLGPAGTILLGHAYRELGLGERMIDLYTNALEQGVPDALHPEMTYDIAEYYLATGDRRLAIERLSDLADSDTGKWSRLAQLRLAEAALDDGRSQDCLAWCRRLLDRPDSDRPTVLRLMGRAFEQLGADHEAALCYGGQVPPP